MTSTRGTALFAAILLALFLWLRPITGRIGEPAASGAITTSEVEAAAGVEKAPDPTPRGAPEHLDAVATAILDLTNAERRKKGLGTLAPESRLAEIATDYCDDMLTRGFFAHIDPDGRDHGDRVARGHRTLVGTSVENLWMASGFSAEDPRALAEKIVRSWMGSQGHSENILRPQLTHLGVGVSLLEDEIRATQLFGRVLAYLDEPLPRTHSGDSPFRLEVNSQPRIPKARQIDLFADGRPLWGPSPVVGSRIDIAPGIYLMRFYFPKEDGYRIGYGPEVEITGAMARPAEATP